MSNERLPPPPGDEELLPDFDDLDAEIAAQAAAEAEQYPPKVEPEPETPTPEITFADVDEVVEKGLEQLGNARLVAKLFKNKLLYDRTTKKPYRYNCQRWVEDTTLSYRRRVPEIAEVYRRRAADLHKQSVELQALGEKNEAKRILARKKLYEKHATKLCDSGYIDKVFDFAASGEPGQDETIAIKGDEWEQHPNLFVAANCVIDLETGKTFKGRPDLYLTKSSQVEFHGLHVEAPVWEDTLDKASCFDKDWREYFDLVVGYAATGLSSYKDFYCAYGKVGNNAKSAIFGIIAKILGEYAVQLPVEMLLDNGRMRNSAGPTPDLMRMRYTRMAVFPEPEKGTKFVIGAIKQYSGGVDKIVGRGMYGQDQLEFPATAKLFVHANEMPKARGNDPAFYSRLRVIPFDACFVLPGVKPPDGANPEFTFEAKPHKVMENLLWAERAGILAYVVRCARRVFELHAQGLPFPIPDRVSQETKEYQASQDLIGSFLEQACVVGEGKTQMKDLHAAFKKWCMEEEGVSEDRVPTQRTFGTDIKARLRQVPPKNVVNYAVTVDARWLPGEGQGQLSTERPF